MRVGADSAEKMRAAVSGSNVKPDEGDEWLRVGGMKLGVDGGFEGGWMREPYAEPWGEHGTFCGVNTMKQAPYTEIVKELNRLGWRVATHAVGDAAIDEVLAAYEAANAERSIAGKRWTIEHGFIPQTDQFPRMKALGLVISAQNHLYLAGPSLVAYWGAEARRVDDTDARVSRSGLRRRRRHRFGRRPVSAALGHLSLRYARYDQRRRAGSGSEDQPAGKRCRSRRSTTPT